MKTKSQKQEELNKGKELFKKSEALAFLDLSGVRTKDLGQLRRELKSGGNPLLVVKKRLLGLILKEKGIAFDSREFKTSVGTVFASNLESAAASVYKFFKTLETEKKVSSPAGEKILGGYDVTKQMPIEAAYLAFIGSLPPREVLLGQLIGTIAAPIRAFLYVLSKKSEKVAS